MADFDLKGIEKQIVSFSKRFRVSASELICISDKYLWDIKSENDIVPLAYEENEDIDALGNYARFSKDKTKVLEAIVNLYLKNKLYLNNEEAGNMTYRKINTSNVTQNWILNKYRMIWQSSKTTHRCSKMM